MEFFTGRVVTPERMDADDIPADELDQSFQFIRTVNRRFSGIEAILAHLRAWSRSWPAGKPVRILDIATGCGDIPKAIVTWARKAGHAVHVTGLDRHRTALELAAAHIGDDPDIALVAGNALELPFAANSFDYCITSMFLHHLHDLEVMTVLKAMDRIGRRGLIWNDLSRNRRARAWVWLLTLGANPIVQHDARVSVAAGFTSAEVTEFRDRVGLPHLRYQAHFAHRFTLAGERPEAGAR